MDAAEKKRGLSAKAKYMWNRLFDSPSQSRPRHHPSAVASPVPSVVNTPRASRVNLAFTPGAHQSLLETESEATSSLPAAALASSYRPTPSQPAQAGLTGALRAIQRGTAAFPPLQAVIGELISCVEAVKISSIDRREYEELAASLEAAAIPSSAPARVEVGSDERVDRKDIYVRQLSLLRARYLTQQRSKRLIEEQVAIIANKRGRTKARYVAIAEQDEAEILSAYRHIDALFRQLSVVCMHQMFGRTTLLEALSPSKLAVYDSKLSEGVARRACAKETRVEVLSALNKWSLDPDAPHIYWLNGMAGTGKTTVAYTFAETLKARKALGASFFCTRTSGECRDVGQVIPTIAYQLADYSPSFRSACEGRDPEGLMVVIDALDECTNPSGAGLILDMLFRAAPNLPIKFFVTSRPEPDIRHRMQSQSTSAGRYTPSSAHPMASRRHNEIDSLYTTILAAALESPNLEEYERERMQLLLWTAVCAASHTVIEVLLQRSGAYQLLSGHCFGIMKISCGSTSASSTSFITDSEVQDLEARKANYIPPTLSYAAHHWGDHVAKCARAEVMDVVRRYIVDLIRSLDDSWLFLPGLPPTDVEFCAAYIYLSTTILPPLKLRIPAVLAPHLPAAVGPRLGSRAKPVTTARTWTMHSEPFALSFYPDGSRFATGFQDGTIHILNQHSGALILGPLNGHTDLVRSILSPSMDPCSPPLLRLHNHRLGCIHWRTTRRPIKAHDDQNSTVPRVSGTHVLQSHTQLPHTSPSFSPTRCILSRRQVHRMWPGQRRVSDGHTDTSTGEQVPGWHMQQGSPMRVISFSLDGGHAVTGHVSGDVRVWSVDRVLAKRKQATHSLGRWDGVFLDPEEAMGTMAVGRHQQDARVLFLTRWDTSYIMLRNRTVKLWNALHSTPLTASPGRPQPTVAHNGAAILEPLVAHTAGYTRWRSRMTAVHCFWSDDQAIYLWDAGAASCYPPASSAYRHDLVGFVLARWQVGCFCLGRQDHADVGLGDDNLIASDLVATHEDTYWRDQLGDSPNDTLIASGSDDGTICMFDSYTGHLVLGPSTDIRAGSGQLVKDGAAVCSQCKAINIGSLVAYSPDGAYIVSGSADSTIRVWKAPGPIAGGLKISDDGWARDDKSQLVFWVPADIVSLFSGFPELSDRESRHPTNRLWRTSIHRRRVGSVLCGAE
ncbi:WD40 repeat-like protein [Rhizoctonia solani]|uniref:WD40 repeat-like protein n=1 Tax=Rhizoctonia solani TaxID=456999 RepID=A0A8H7I166_9AGAM|nr:WD40 repeat-like protein [Rhizoctonia solani]